MEKLIVATKYHDIVGLLDTHLNQGEVNVMIKENKTFFQDFHEPLLIPSKTRGIMVLIKKTYLSVWSATTKLLQTVSP